MSDTIFALASAPGRAAIAVWRLSGSGTAEAIRLLTGRKPPSPRKAVLRRFADPRTGDIIDQGLILWFPGPASFTGEDSAEIHLHGGRAVGETMAAALSELPGLRQAEAGEFSRRAFLNGKFDLTEAEAIADLAAAETEAQRRQALRQADGGLRDLYDGWRETLIRLLARREAALEFPDEDIGDPVRGLAGEIESLRVAIARHLADAHRGERLREGLVIAVIGAPNAGKSSLVNALARRDVAIVSPEAGTTRDAIEVHLDLGGYPVTIIDTAGLRAAEGVIEAEGIARTRARAESADLVLALFDSTVASDSETLGLVDERAIIVSSKLDLSPSPDGFAATLSPLGRRKGGGTSETLAPTGRGRDPREREGEGVFATLHVSVKTGAGMDDLLQTLTARVRDLFAETGVPPPTRARHREALARCVAGLDAAMIAPDPELTAEELRRAAGELGRITGRIDIEEMLDSIFREFCIGK